MGCGLECGLLLSLCTMKNFLAIGFIWIFCALAREQKSKRADHQLRRARQAGDRQRRARLRGRASGPTAPFGNLGRTPPRTSSQGAALVPYLQSRLQRPLCFSERYAGDQADRIELPTGERERGARWLQGARRKRQMG